jgi:peptide-methionine (S)-S-oxide reductase
MASITMKATFAAGCFWGVESLFRQVKGVKSTQVGYAGGTLENPTYEDVCSGGTGHAESIEIDYEPSVVSYEELLKIFWNNHNPTTINQQGPDIGEQYRSVVFFHSPEQEKVAKELMEKLQPVAIKQFGKKIVTEIVPAKTFFRAEEYHQRYLEKNGYAHCSSKLN